MVLNKIDAETAIKWLKEGNNDYINAKLNHYGDISKEKRMHTHLHGQAPFAVIITCSDSRVIPESIFMKGIGDLFVIRLAGNVVGDFALGSVEYALEHLGCKLVVVMGHTSCGAILASLDGHHDNYIGSITTSIKKAIGNTNNSLVATKLNVLNSIKRIEEDLIVKNEEKEHNVKVLGAIYHTKTGHVEFF